jgi:hypothetical protein
MTQAIEDTIEDTIEEKEALVKKMIEKYNEISGENYFINQMMNKESKTGRNNRCHCGSGKKYKNCCLFLYEEKRARSIELHDTMKDLALNIMKKKLNIKREKDKEKDKEKLD